MGCRWTVVLRPPLVLLALPTDRSCLQVRHSQCLQSLVWTRRPADYSEALKREMIHIRALDLATLAMKPALKAVYVYVHMYREKQH